MSDSALAWPFPRCDQLVDSVIDKYCINLYVMHYDLTQDRPIAIGFLIRFRCSSARAPRSWNTGRPGSSMPAISPSSTALSTRRCSAIQAARSAKPRKTGAQLGLLSRELSHAHPAVPFKKPPPRARTTNAMPTSKD